MKKFSILMATLVVFTACGADSDDMGRELKAVEMEAPEKSAEEVLKEASMNGAELRSGEYEFMMSMMGEDPLMGKIDFELDGEGSFNFMDTTNPMFSISLDMEIEAPNEDLSEQNMELEMRFVDGTIFAQVEELSDFDGELPMEMVEDYLYKWLKVELPAEFDGMVAGFFEELYSEENMNFTGDVDNLNDLAYVEGVELDGRPAYKYSFTMDGDSIGSVYDEVGIDINTIAPEIDTLDMSGYIFVDKEDMLITRMEMDFGIDDVDGVDFDYEFVMQSKNMGGDVKVEAPSDAEDLTPLVESFFGLMMMDASYADPSMTGEMSDAELAEMMGMTEEELEALMAEEMPEAMEVNVAQ